MTRLPSRARRALLALTALFTTALAVLAPTASALPGAVPGAGPGAVTAAQPQTFGIQPASAAGPDRRAAFTYAATPGAQLKDHVAVYNYGDEPLTLSLYAADAFNTVSGGYDVLPASGHSTDLGAWVHLAVGTVTLPPRTRQIIPFTLAVPANAGPGDHSAGVVLALRRHQVDAKGNDIAVDQRVGTRIHLRVPGALRPRLAVQSVAVRYRGTLNPFGTGTTTVTYTVRNTGNIRLSGRQAVRIRNAVGGVTTASGPGALTELLPGNAETWTVQLHGVVPTLWSTASITVDPLAVPGDTDPALPSATSDSLFAAVPWTLIALLLPLLALVAGLLLRRRRRRQGPGGASGPGGSPAPAPPAEPTSPTRPTEPTIPGSAVPSPTGPWPERSDPIGVPVPVPVAAGTSDASGEAPAASAPAGGPALSDPAAVPALPLPAAPGGAPVAGGTDADAGDDAAPAEKGASTSAFAVVAARLGALALAMAAACSGLLGGASVAFADGASPTASALAGAGGASGSLWFDYASGHDDDPIDVATSGRCPGQDGWLSATLSGPGFPAGGASALGLSAASIYPAASTGGYVVPLDQTLRSLARQSGVSTLHGAYRLDVFCRTRFQPAHLRDFVGTLTFATPGAWTADRATPVAMPESTEPPMTARPLPAPTAAPAPGDTSALSVLATAAGALLLIGLAVSALRTRRARVLRERLTHRSRPTPDAAPRRPARRPTPDATAPEQVRPEAAEPDAGGPDPAGRDATAPEQAGPDAAEPDAAGPDTARPDTAGSDAAGPDAAGCDAAAERGVRAVRR